MPAPLSRRVTVVAAVSATDAYVIIRRLHIPLDRVLAVHKPSLLGDSTARGGQWSGPRPRVLAIAAGQLHFA